MRFFKVVECVALMNKADMAAMEAERRKNERMYKRMLMPCVRQIDKQIADQEEPSKLIARLRQFSESLAFLKIVERAVSKMVKSVGFSVRGTWKQAAKSSIHGKTVQSSLRNDVHNTAVRAAASEIVANNSRLIKTVPQDIASQFPDYALQMTTKGVRPAEIVEEMKKKAPQLAAYQIRRIARTESAKAATAMMQARCQAIGCEWYLWHTCEDERVRSTHAHMEGVLCRWSDPPNPEVLFPAKGIKAHGAYHPGGIYNCRCIALPMIDPEDIRFPCKAHVRGRIVTVGSLKEFNRLSAA